MECPRCSKVGLVQIEMRLGGEEVTLRSCAKCEGRWWVRGDETLSLEEVLHLAAA